MRSRLYFLIGLCLLLLAGAWLFWPAADRTAKQNSAKDSAAPRAAAAQGQAPAAPGVSTTKSASTAPLLFGTGKTGTNTISATKTNPFPYRLANTTRPIGELMHDGRAVLLANAFIDTGASLNLGIPSHLSAAGDPGTYIVQSRAPMDAAFRAQLAAAGAAIVSYIPNNAYLVRMSAGGAAAMAGQPTTSAVLPYEPYYKLSASLLGAAVAQKALPEDATLTLGLFADNAAQTIEQIEKLGGTVLATDRSPFGPMVRVLPPKNWTALAVLTGVQIVEPARERAAANDLARVALGISTDTVTNASYGGLSGSNVLVVVNDTGVDASHPDFSVTGSAAAPGTVPPSRVSGVTPNSITDTNGHGTHVAGIIAGNGSMSLNPTNVGSQAQGSVTNADFRGKAPAARLLSVAALNNQAFKTVSDRELQEIPALTNALISNNSWAYEGDDAYDLAAASYDAAVRDALPETMGSQPVLFVFAAGNDGGGNDDGGGGAADTVLSPGTAKNVITVGALEQSRNITNEVTSLDGTTNAVWAGATDSSFQVAGYSARGNVGVGSEGTYGRFKPDVVAPGSFVVSTRSQQWDQAAYYNPTNYERNTISPEVVDPNSLHYYSLLVPNNAVGVTITLTPNALSPEPFPNLPIYVKLTGTITPASYDILTVNNSVSIPPDSGGAIGGIGSLVGKTFSYAVGSTNNLAVSYVLTTVITTTNDQGNYFEVLSNLNDTLGPFYYYESGTSMATPAVSGVLALMQDYFTNSLHATPSPALLKAMLINGARAVGNYNLVVTNEINFQGWGQPSVPNSVPNGITNQFNAPCASFFADQSPTNALATGDQRSYQLTVTTNDVDAVTQPLRVTLAWTDPPGDPVAATKLVNNLDLMVSNTVTHEVFWGNDIPYNSLFNSAWDTNAPPNLDTVNNVENVFLSSSDGGSYTVTVIGRGVNVNAVTAQTNDVVQDYALVISAGDGAISNALTIAAATLVSHPTDAQLITFVTNSASSGDQTSVGGVLLNQHVGANTPLLGTNTISVSTNTVYATNALITLGMTNQWHFYVVTNTTTFTNAAFVTFFPNTLSLPRMGVYEDSEANATTPEADIDLYVTTNPAITNLDPAAIAGADKSLSDGGTEFVVYSNSTLNQVYYIGVKSETAEAAEYGFLSVFSQSPFSTMQNGKQVVNGLLLPVTIPDGTPSHPGVAYVFALAVMPMQVQNVTVSNQITHQLFSDLVGVLNHDGKNVVLNNKAGLFSDNNIYTNVYNDSGNGLLPGSTPSDGPGSLFDYQGLEAIGPWIITMVDNSHTATGAVTALTFSITPHKDLKEPGTTISLEPGEFFVDYIDVPVGVINLTVAATNLPPTSIPPIQLYVSPFVPPTIGGTNGSMVLLTNCAIGTYPSGTFAGNSISTGPPLVPGRYYVGLYNPDLANSHDVFVTAKFTFSAAAITTSDFTSTNATAIVDDAVSYASLFVTNQDLVQSFQVGVRVDHPRISDLVFHLISPNGTRYLLMENRGALSTNGAGLTIVTTNTTPVSSSGGPDATTNLVNVGKTFGSVAISWDFFTVPDMMDVYYEGVPIFSTGLVSGSGSTNLIFGPGASTDLAIVMNATNHPAQTLWTYTVGGVQTNYYYLTFTADTNLTTTPIKFAPPPFVPVASSGILWSDSFETDPLGTYPPSLLSGWTVITNQVDIVTNPPAADGNNLLQLGNGAVRTTLPTVVGGKYILSFQQGSRASDDITVPVATNANWHSVSVIFTANSASTPLILNASGIPLTSTNGQMFNFDTNALVDAFSLTTVPGNLFYLPEEDISDLNNQSAYGLWQLEIQDDRVGAGLTNTLLSWQLELVYANTNATYPPVITTPATNVTSSSATLTALVYPGGLDTTLYFEYGTNSTDLTNFSGTFTLTDLLTQQALGIPVTNLTADTLYYFQAVTTNSAGATNFGGVLSFFAHSGPLPYAATLPATLVTGTSAQLNGMATPNGLPSIAWFQWGTNTLYGNQTTNVSVGAGTNVVYTTAPISGLTTNVAYHFRLVVSNAFAVTYGFDQILDEAYVVAWGADYVGQVNVPTNLNNVVAIAAAYDHSLALKTNGTAVGWGDNNFGQATVPAGLSNLVALAGGDSYSLGLQSSGTVVAWGANNLGQTNVPPGLTNVVNIASGTFSCLALNADGSVVTWGLFFLNAPTNLNNLVALAGGRFHSLALKNDGTVTGWGDNGSGQLNVPTNLNNAVAIAAGSFHSLALRYDGTVVAWGDNSAGQTNVPAGLNNVVAIAAGGFDSLALRSDGTLVGWGDNSAGQLSVPPSLTNMVAISSGLLHSLALTPQSLSSLTNPVVLNLTNGVVVTNTIVAGGLTFYQVNVPTNADFATNTLLFALNGPLNIWFTTNSPPSIATNASLLLAGVTNGVSILSTTSVPTNIVPGGTYYLGVQNTNTVTVNYAIGVTFHLLDVTNVPPTPPNISGIIYTNGGFLLTWFAPSNELFQVQFTTNLAPANWITFTNIISYNTNVLVGPTNAQFNFFDDGVLYPFGATRFYRLILLASAGNTPPAFAFVPTNRVINPLNTLTVTNSATDSDSPAQTLTYTLLGPPAGAVISTNGVITWTPTVAQAGTSNIITTIVTDSGAPNLSATNSFAVIVNPLPVLNRVTYVGGNFLLEWLAPTNDIFEVQVATNLSSPVWLTQATNITYAGPVTPTNGWFSYLDTGFPVPFGPIRFYRLVLTGVTTSTTPPPAPIVISSVIFTNGGFQLTWSAPTNDQFQVRWTTNLAPPSWTIFPGTNTSTTGTFIFLDTNAPMLMKFYELILLP